MPQEPRPKKLLDQMRDVLRTQHYAIRTEKAYIDWAKRFILFHQKRHPTAMGPACARGLQPSHDNRPRRLKPQCNSLRLRPGALSGWRAAGGLPGGLQRSPAAGG